MAFHDLRVLDLGWIWAGPLVTSAFADLGADVVKVESSTKLDPYRLRGVERDPRYADQRHEASPSFHKLNRGKRSVTIDLRHADAADLVLDLAGQADLLVENFSAGTLTRLGVTWERLHERNPRLVVLAMSGGGQSQRWRELRAYALVTTALAGYESLIGYPGEPPIGGATFGIADPNASAYAVLAGAAAVWRARRTGQGAYLDVSAIESMASILGAAFVSNAERPAASVSVTLPVPGDDQWVAVLLVSQTSTDALAGAAGIDAPPVWEQILREPKLLSTFGEEMSAWSRQQDGLAERLTNLGLTATPVLSIEQRDAWEATRMPTQLVEHPVTGVEATPLSPWGTTVPLTPAPLLGAHNVEVLAEWLGRDTAEVNRLRESGVLS